jgi:hypothetical protein
VQALAPTTILKLSLLSNLTQIVTKEKRVTSRVDSTGVARAKSFAKKASGSPVPVTILTNVKTTKTATSTVKMTNKVA